MAITVDEMEDSRRYHQDGDEKNDRASDRYFCTGSEDQGAIIVAIEAQVPQQIPRPDPSKGYLVLASIAVRNEQISDVWSAVVTYLDPARVNDKYQIGNVSTAYDTGGQRRKVFQGVPEDNWPKQVTIHGGGVVEKGKVPDDQGGSAGGIEEGIPNVLDMKDGNGVEVPVGSLGFRETHVFGAQGIDLAFMREVAELRGRTNKSRFRGNDPGEVLFLGATARQPGSGDANWEVDFHFVISPNQNYVEVYLDDATPSNSIVFDHVGGHEYIQFLRVKSIKEFTIGNQVFKIPVPKVVAAFVHKIHEDGDFSKLRIGTN